MNKILVTGANGFIGSHLVRELLKRGDEVRCLIRNTSDISSLKDLSVPLYIGDLCDPDSLEEPTKNVDYIYHLAAETLVTNKEAFIKNNTKGTINLLEAA